MGYHPETLEVSKKIWKVPFTTSILHWGPAKPGGGNHKSISY